MKSEVFCKSCGTFCGWQYEDSYDEPGYFDGNYDYIDDQGVVYCSWRCMEEEENEKI